jgi:predicted heme/steroid binding protein/uncharacterized membrane protein
MADLTTEELAQYNGKEGKPAYVAHGGKVYDVTRSRFWKNARHMNRHEPGRDLTGDIQAAPHGLEVLERIPLVGELKPARAVDEARPPSKTIFDRFPILRRHPHPMMVHFPIVFMIFTPVFHILYLITGRQAFEFTSLHLLGAAILLMPVAMFTGFLTWWLNYGKPLRAVTIKITFSIFLMIVSAGAFLWQAVDAEIYRAGNWAGILYLVLLLSLIPLVTIVGWYGAQLTFPLGKD